jgi:hypothetical protein
MKLADLQAKLAGLKLTATKPQALPIPTRPSRKRAAEPCPYDDIYYTAADLTDADKVAIARFHYAYFTAPPSADMRPEDLVTREILKKHTLLEWGPYLSLAQQAEIRALYGQ